MDANRAKKFNEKMGRINLTKGGYIKKDRYRKYFDAGGIAQNANAPGVGGPGNPTNTNITGIGGINAGLGLAAPSGNIQQGTNAAQLNNAYTGANNAINAEVGLANTLTPQAATGVNAQNQVLAEQLAIANGAGPNPAQAQLAQATGTNVANEAALLAGQRGASGNVGLAAKNIGTQGAGTLQNAAGQAATLEAQQQIAAQQNAATIAANQIAQTQGATTALNTAQQNEENILENANTSGNNAAVGMQSNINNVNAANNQGLLGGISSALGTVGGFLGLEKGGEVGKVGEKIHPHAKHKFDFIHKMTKMGLEHFDGGGSILPTGQGENAEAQPAPSPSAAPIDTDKAKEVENSFKNVFADGGQIQGNPLTTGMSNVPPAQGITPQYTASEASSGPIIPQTQIPQANVADSFKSGLEAEHKNSKTYQMNTGLKQAQQTFNNQLSTGPAQTLNDSSGIYAAHGGDVHEMMLNHFNNYFAGGGKVPAMVSPGEVYLDKSAVEQVKHGADPLKVGMRIPGKAKVKGDSLKNDTVPADLEEGGVVIDREHVGNSDKARLFTLKSLRATGKHLKRPQGMK